MRAYIKTILVAVVVACMSYIYKLNILGKTLVSQVKNITMPASEHFTIKRSPQPLPIFFLSHGGPTFQDKDDPLGGNLGAWKTTRKIGEYIRNKVNPDFIIVVSAHWQTENPDEIEVSTHGEGEAWYTQNGISSRKLRPDENALVYDFYGFPKRFYDSQFHTLANNFLANDIVESINDSDWLQAKTQERGIDHGVFVPFKVAFGDPNIIDSNKLDIDVPVIQVSLPGSDDIEISYRLGEALAKYRDLNAAIIFSGMSVHNLRDFRFALGGDTKARPYAKPFNDLLTEILTSPDKSKVLEKLKQLPRNPEWASIYKGAHPTNEHLLPAIAAAGASRGDKCNLLYSDVSGSLGWNLYSWGDISEF